jgi:hypothetical protein
VRDLAKRQADDEHADWAIVSKTEIPAPLWQKMTPVARAAWQRWHGTTPTPEFTL